MFKQILTALEASTTDIIFFAEHDMLYPSSHFDFIPPKKDIFYYDRNWWKVRTSDGYCIHYEANQLSGLCAYRELLIKEFKERVRRISLEGWKNTMGYEPGTRGKRRGGFTENQWAYWHAPDPHIDIKHAKNQTHQRWYQKQFKHKENCEGWLTNTADKIPEWPGLMELLGIPHVHGK